VITAIVLIGADIDAIPETASELAALEHVSEVYSVTGEYDLVALVRVREHEALAGVVTDGIAKLPGVLATETLVAFRAYSRHDLAAMFSIGG